MTERDDKELIAKAFTTYRDFLLHDTSSDLEEYNRVEIESLNDLARRLELDEEYYDPGAFE